jgi:AraC family transcriptional regulator
MSHGEHPEHLHLLEAGWDGFHFIYELEPADEMPASYMSQHLVIIALDNFRASFDFNGNWQHIDYTQGDIGIFPASQLFPRTQVDREVPILDLFLAPATLYRAVDESIEENCIELIPQLQLRDPLIQQIGLALKAELAVGGAESRLYAESMVTALSAHLLRRYTSRQQTIRDYRGGLPKYKQDRAIVYIHENLDRNITLTELSNVVNMSPHYFATLFKQSTGQSPHQYITKCRIETAKHLLAKQELTIVEISQQVGFQNQSHFTRIFRQHVKTTPKIYRDKQR